MRDHAVSIARKAQIKLNILKLELDISQLNTARNEQLSRGLRYAPALCDMQISRLRADLRKAREMLQEVENG